MKLQFIMFLTIITSFLIISSLYLGIRITTKTQWGEAHQGVVWLSLILFVGLQFLGPFLYRNYPNQLSRFFVLHWVVYTTLGIFVCMIFYNLVGDAISYIWKFFFPVEDPTNFERRNFLIVSGLTLGSAAIGISQAKLGPRIYDIEVPLDRLPKEFDDFRIAQISDLHVGPTIGKSYVEDVVQKINGLNADLVALTGDFVDGTVEQLREQISPLSQIKSKHGMFFITGNHEYYWGVDGWLKEFEKMGARTLLNEHILIKQNGSEFVLAGVTDISASHMHPLHKSDPEKAIIGAPKEAVKILLAHQPKSFSKAEKAGFDLQLSGHTHGGQFFPFSLAVKFLQPYYKGLNRFNKMWIYVNRGTGYWGPPIRFTVPSEITLIRLKSVKV